jgi:hypothetical protein
MERIKEPAREGFLYQIWIERSFHRTLKTVDGREVKIVEKGLHNYDAGPDFLNVLIKLDGELVRGDVEIHPIAGDWYAHGHHTDPRYNNVVLHVVTMACPPSFQTRCQDGHLVPSLNLDDYLEKTAEELEIENGNEKKEPARNFDSCSLKQKDDLTKQRVLEWASMQRLETKIERFVEKRSSESWDQILYEAIFEAFGYSKNKIPFRNLAEFLPVEKLWSLLWNDPPNIAQRKCDAYLFGAAGLLPSQSKININSFSVDDRSYVDELETYWIEFPYKNKIDPLKTESWLFFRLRPQNFPTRRLAAASIFVLRFLNEGFIGAFEKIINNCNQNPKLATRELVTRLKVEATDFWTDHFSFSASDNSGTLSSKAELIIGTDRARDIIANVVLPVMIAYSREIADSFLEISLKQIYTQFPNLSENEITRLMRQQLFEDQKGGKNIVKGILQQQGLIQLQSVFCEENDCRKCLDDYSFL